MYRLNTNLWICAYDRSVLAQSFEPKVAHSKLQDIVFDLNVWFNYGST